MAERPVVNGRVESSNLSSSACLLMSEFDNEEKVISQYSQQTNRRIAPMVEHCVEAAAVQVRILFRLQKVKQMIWNRNNNNGEN